jgi:flagellar assembly protein FliH
MVKLQKYLFDTDFGTPRIAAVDMTYVEDEDLPEPEPDLPPPPTFSEEELALARDQAFEAGRQQGLQEAAAALDQMVGMAMAGCAHYLQALGAEQHRANEEMVKDSVAVAVAIVHKLHPEFARLHGMAEIEAALTECLSNVDRVPKITIKVHPDLVAEIQKKCASLASQASFEGKLIVASDSLLALGDCRLDWGDGGAERSTARSWADIDHIVATTLGTLNTAPATGL